MDPQSIKWLEVNGEQRNKECGYVEVAGMCRRIKTEKWMRWGFINCNFQ